MNSDGLGLLVILFFFGMAGGIIGRMKGSSFFVWFLVSFCIPFVGLMTAILYRWDSRELRRECPNCHRLLKLYDAVCVTCGAELDFPDTAVASEQQVRARRVSAAG